MTLTDPGTRTEEFPSQRERNPWDPPQVDVLEPPLTVKPPMPGDVLPSAPSRAATLRQRLPWRRILRLATIAVVLTIPIVLIYDKLVAGVVYEQRQKHLAADFTQAHPTVSSGQAIAVLQIPAIGMNVVVAEGEARDTLRGAPGHRSGSAVPGGPGTSVILGHRDAYGGPFEKLSKLKPGDQIAVQTKASPAFLYTITDVLTGPDEATDVAFVPKEGEARLLLITSRGGWFEDKHTVVIATGNPVLGGPTAEKVGTGLDPSDAGAPFGAEALVANLGALALMIGLTLLKGRHRAMVRAAAVLPIGVFVAITFAMAFEAAFPALR